jgi:hypothetical protein
MHVYHDIFGETIIIMVWEMNIVNAQALQCGRGKFTAKYLTVNNLEVFQCWAARKELL